MTDSGFDLDLYLSPEDMRNELKKLMMQNRELERKLKDVRGKVYQLENKVWKMEHNIIGTVSVL